MFLLTLNILELLKLSSGSFPFFPRLSSTSIDLIFLLWTEPNRPDRSNQTWFKNGFVGLHQVWFKCKSLFPRQHNWSDCQAPMPLKP